MTALQTAAKRYADASSERDKARDILRNAVVDAVTDGMPEAEAARVAGVDRMTIRAWLGKR